MGHANENIHNSLNTPGVLVGDGYLRKLSQIPNSEQRRMPRGRGEVMKTTDSGCVSPREQGRLGCAPQDTCRVTKSLSFDGGIGDNAIELVT